jgi:hypothetical protein
VLSDLASAIADSARLVSDFGVAGDRRELFGQVTWVPTAWGALSEAACGGDRAPPQDHAAVSKARRLASAHCTARSGGLPLDRKLEGVVCIRLDAILVTAHADKTAPGRTSTGAAGTSTAPIACAFSAARSRS